MQTHSLKMRIDYINKIILYKQVLLYLILILARDCNYYD